MEDGIIKQTGNSRYLKSSITPGTTWEQALALLTAGEFPVDFNGIFPDGWEKLGTALNKANFLSDLTAAKFGNAETVNAVLDILSQAAILTDGELELPDGSAVPAVKISTGSYIGTGTAGVNNPCTLTFNFPPDIVIIQGNGLPFSGASYYSAGFNYTAIFVRDGYGSGGTVQWTGTSLTWYAAHALGGTLAEAQQNQSGITYRYLAIGHVGG